MMSTRRSLSRVTETGTTRLPRSGWRASRRATILLVELGPPALVLDRVAGARHEGVQERDGLHQPVKLDGAGGNLRRELAQDAPHLQR